MIIEAYWPGTALVLPFLGDGFTRSGIYVAFDPRLPPILGRILAVTRFTYDVRPGDVVVFRPHAFEECESILGTVRVIHEQAIAGVIRDFDTR